MSTTAAIRCGLIITKTKAIIEQENDKIDKLKTERESLLKKCGDKFDQRLWLFRVLVNKNEYTENRTRMFCWNIKETFVLLAEY